MMYTQNQIVYKLRPWEADLSPQNLPGYTTMELFKEPGCSGKSLGRGRLRIVCQLPALIKDGRVHVCSDLCRILYPERWACLLLFSIRSTVICRYKRSVRLDSKNDFVNYRKIRTMYNVLYINYCVVTYRVLCCNIIMV